ncbi:MAG TPA: hypothetical protein DEP35_22865 [Deltaproteobacteria bacterium]|nr:hypothetical protein [Deltaproteobacteria bacterium]
MGRLRAAACLAGLFPVVAGCRLLVLQPKGRAGVTVDSWSPIGGGLGSREPTPCVPATQPAIPYAEGWLGADGGASVPLPDGSSVWLFGDSFIGEAGAANRDHAAIVNNTIGISACNGTRWGAMDHYWRQFETTPEAFFNPYGVGFDWPLEAFYSGSSLYALLQRGERTPRVGQGFELTGTDLAIISTTNPTVWTKPWQWKQQIVPINTSAHAYPDSTAIVDGAYVYIYTSLSGYGYTSSPMMVVRAPLDNLGSIASSLEYLSASTRTWEPGLVESDAQIVMDQGASEMSVRFHPAQNEWIAVYIPADLAATQIVMRTAPNYLGPWSDPQPIYQIPEMTPTNPTHKPNTFCYAAREHIEWVTDTSMVVTYACNSRDFSTTLLTDMELYRPVPVTIPLQP